MTAGTPLVIGEAPGRIHYLGAKAEVGGDYFLSSGIDRCVQVAVSPRQDNSLRFFASVLTERKRTTVQNLKYKREDRWANNIKISIQLFLSAGCPVHGLNFSLCGDIPQRIALASSSSIEIAAALAMRRLYLPHMSDKELIRRMMEARLVFFEKETNAVDYLVCMNAKKDTFLIVDEKKMEVQKVKSPFGKHKLLLLDSRVPWMGVEDELKARRSDLRRGLKLLVKAYQKPSFRDYEPAELGVTAVNLPEEMRRRCIHVVEENLRIQEVAEDMKRSDYAAIQKVFQHSHESLRDMFEVSCPEIDWLVRRSLETPGSVGARMMGRGFGGAVYSFQTQQGADEMIDKLEEYERIFGFHPNHHEVKIASGARLVQAIHVDADGLKAEDNV
jgi:galactokinase